MSQTIVTNDIPEYPSGFLTATEYALIEACAISGRDSVRNALVRNGYLDGRLWSRDGHEIAQHTQELPVIEPEVDMKQAEYDEAMRRLARLNTFASVLIYVAIPAAWLAVLITIALRLTGRI